jgi:hypothetical protein
MKSLANIAGCVDDIMATCGDHPELLVQYLCRIQWRYNCIPPEAIELLAVRLLCLPARNSARRFQHSHQRQYYRPDAG